ncbi:MAG: HAMP domain-containing histidine kinase [Sphingobacteriales bacterium]|nr:MAG: HAMP domain-containing histidine kinase [Sphingobacteriales bacterium]
MKLLNHTLSYLSVILLFVIGLWAGIFYINMIDEIHDSIDDGLDNSKQLIIRKALVDSQTLTKQFFHERNYKVKEITAQQAKGYTDTYIDSTLFMENEQDYEPVRILKTVFMAGNGRYYQLDIVSSMVEEDDLIEDLFYALLWLYGIILATVLVVNNLLLRKIWKPFYQLLDKLGKFRLGSNDSFQPPATRVLEFNRLNDSLEALIAHTKETYAGQKQFIENAAHELQTPLAVSISKLELLAENEAATEEQLTEIGAVMETLQRMKRLNKNLLLLAKIESGQFPEEESVSINNVVKDVIPMLEDMAAHKGVEMAIVEEAELVVNMNPSLAEVLVTNLIKNAIVHNTAGGVVDVVTNASGFSVKNTATGHALDAGHIFERFYKNGSSKNTTGLGLAIVKSIATHYGYTVSYSYANAHVFIVQMK